MAVAMIALVGWDHVRPAAQNSDDWTRFDHQTFRVTHVIDGDTIQIRQNDDSPVTTVRLIGIDAPDLHDPTTGQPAHWAERSAAYAKARCEGKPVTLRLEPIGTRDHYNRLLAYAYLSDIDCLNMDMVYDGQAYADRRFTHSFKPQYEQAENEARRKQRGLWKGLSEDQMPAWRRVWLHAFEK